MIFRGDNGRTTHAVDKVDLAIARGTTLGIVGKIRLAGKSVTSLAIMGLLPKTSAEISGSVRFDGIDLLSVPDAALRDLRGDRLAMIFQEPMTSLNPSFTIGEQIIETLMRHRRPRSCQGRATGRSRCCVASISPRLNAASTTTHTSCRAACASAS